MNEVRKLLLGKWSQWGPKHSSEETPWGPRVGGDAVRTETVVVRGGFASFFCRRTREATDETPSGQRETSSVVGLEPSCDGARESLSLVMGFDRWRRRRRRKRRHEERDGRTDNERQIESSSSWWVSIPPPSRRRRKRTPDGGSVWRIGVEDLCGRSVVGLDQLPVSTFFINVLITITKLNISSVWLNRSSSGEDQRSQRKRREDERRGRNEFIAAEKSRKKEQKEKKGEKRKEKRKEKENCLSCRHVCIKLHL